MITIPGSNGSSATIVCRSDRNSARHSSVIPSVAAMLEVTSPCSTMFSSSTAIAGSPVSCAVTPSGASRSASSRISRSRCTSGSSTRPSSLSTFT